MLALAGLWLQAVEPASLGAAGTPTGLDKAWAAEASGALDQLPPARKHYQGITEAEADTQLKGQDNYGALQNEKVQGRWFAALVSLDQAEPFSVRGRFDTWTGLLEFLHEQNALVEVWTYGEAMAGKPRRLTATEVAELKGQRREQPTFITVTYRDPATGKAVSYRVEFGLRAAELMLTANRGYYRHRQFQLTAQRILGARDGRGMISAAAQWQALQKALSEGELSLQEMPAKPATPNDLLVAFEYEVDQWGNYCRVAGIYRESEILREVQGEQQILLLKKGGQKEARQALGFRRRGVSDQLEPAPNPILGQDLVELRVQDSTQPDPRRWNVVEFGEPELLKQAALARFSLLSAHLERQRKMLAVKRSGLSLIVEPMIAGLNVGGGLSGVGFPVGDAGRIVYNLISWRLVASVPSAKQMRELFAMMAARESNPALKAKPERYLSPQDIKQLKESGRRLSDAQVQEYLERMSQSDVEAMLRLARMGMVDAHVSNFLNLLTSVFKTSGVSDQPNVLRDLFNNVRFSMSGEINLKTLLAIAVGQRNTTLLSGTSLERLSRGEGLGKAWLQYLEVSVDVRAVLNTIVRLSKRTLARKELDKPFPYAPRLSDWAAYEVRIFGFPLFMFYKRGLIRADFAAYQTDYAYGVRGVKLVEHFRTREEMDAEIRAGRMFPLGFVRVPDGKGGWKDTNLAVFAHRMARGKYRGKTAIVLYGLRAYAEHSEFIERELKRFEDYEKALVEGAVIEQLAGAEAAAGQPAREFEPILHVGAGARREVYDPLLGGLLELRRHALRKTWGLPPETDEPQQLSAVRAQFAARGIQLPEDNALVAVDNFNSSFIYRRLVGGQRREVKVTSIPSLAEARRELDKAEEAEQVEAIRREAAGRNCAGVVFLNEVLEKDGRLEIGPLLRDAQGRVLGAGIISEPAAVEAILRQVDELPVTDRARLRFNKFAATVLPLDPRGEGTKKNVFLTVEFPLGEVKRQWTNPLSGELEVVVYERGLWRRLATDRRIVEMEYDQASAETRSRTYVNRGTRQDPRKGELLEETRTLEVWSRDTSQPNLDPYLPAIAKLRLNYVTGQISRETYGLFPLPVETADDQYVTRNRFNAYGMFHSATAWENGRTEADFERSNLAKVLDPIPGRERFALAAQMPQLDGLRDLAGQGYKTTVERRDVVKGLTRTELLDNGSFGRKVGERWLDSFDAAKSFSAEATLEYRDDFHWGLVPLRTALRSLPGGVLLKEVATLSYDPRTRRACGLEVDYTGKASTNTWDYRWASPIEVKTASRQTTQAYNRDETAVTGTTVCQSSRELVSSFAGHYDPSTRTWRITREAWYRPGVRSRVETNVYSGFGRLLSTRVGQALETRPGYDADGREVSGQTFGWNSATGNFDNLVRQEDQYRWQKGERQAQVRLFVAGQLSDQYELATDGDGRTILDGLRQYPGLELKTAIVYEGATERTLRAEVFQNGERRALHEVLPEVRQADGVYLVPVRVVPFWGLVSTNTYRLDDPLGRLVSGAFENGDRATVLEWHPGTAMARVAEVADRHGRAKEHFVRRLNAGTENGIAYDLVARYKVSFWGGLGLAESKAVVRGTDVSLFNDTPESRVYFDLARPYESPRYAADPSGHFGLQTFIAGAVRSNVTAVFRSRLGARRDTARPARPAEQVLETEAVDLLDLFYHQVSWGALDRAGNLLESKLGKIENLGPRGYSEEAIFAAVAQAPLTRQFSYRYEPGWVSEQAGTTPGSPALVFSKQPPPSTARSWRVNDGQWREWPTEVHGRFVAAKSRLDATMPGQYLFRRLGKPRMLFRNPHLPACTNVWTAWTSAELDPQGEVLYESEVIFDAQGQPSATVTHKVNSLGRPALKVAYLLPVPGEESWQTKAAVQGPNQVSFSLAGPRDFSPCDFLAFYLEAGAGVEPSLELKDALGHTVRVVATNAPGLKDALLFWPVGNGQAQWLPNSVIPERGAVVGAPAPWVAAGKVFAVSVPSLAKAGLEVRRVAAAVLAFWAPAAGQVKVSPLYPLAHNQPFLASGQARRFHYARQGHASGLATFTGWMDPLDTEEIRTGRGWNSQIQFNGRTVGLVNPRDQAPYYPVAVLVDSAEADSPQPLYKLAADDGKFLEYYQTDRAGDAQVYTVVRGFDTPKLEVFHAGILDDEISPGYLAFGYGYYVAIPLAKASGGLAKTIANLHNRCIASAFTLGGDRFLQFLFGVEPAKTEFGRLSRELRPASRQAAEIERLPLLASALLPLRVRPWPQGERVPAAPVGLGSPTNVLADYLNLLSTKYPHPQTELIPTSLGTAAERFVDTVQEAQLIRLAVKLNEPSLANNLLAFYWEKSQGGTNALHASYDAKTGASLGKETKYARPSEARQNAQAQLAMAEAAFCVGVATGDTNALEFGKNLVSLVLKTYRPSLRRASWPRGIAELPPKEELSKHGLTLWPEAKTYSLESNARAYLLLARLVGLMDRYHFAPAWKDLVRKAAQEQAAWLTNRIIPPIQKTGVVPKGLFEIQDVHTKSTAYAAERWTAAEDWLAFLEAADRLGVPKETTRAWLENLARVHGVSLGGAWGLDWSIGLRRPDAISPELTARFARVARLLEHPVAGDFAEQNLNRLRQGDKWPVVVTTAPTNALLATGQGFWIYPAIGGTPAAAATRSLRGWPETLGVYLELFDQVWPTNLQAGKALETTRSPERDITQFFWTAAGFYLAILGAALFWWRLSALRKQRRRRRSSQAAPGPLVPEAVMQKAEERWAKRVLGARTPPNAERTRYSNAATEQNFHMQLRAIYKLVLEWRRMVNGWQEDDPRLVEDGTDMWLNGLDEFAAMVGVYSRWVVKAGKKDGARRADVLEENEDSNHIWARLVMYFSESHVGLLELLRQYKEEPAAAEFFGVNSQIELVLRTMGVGARPQAFDARKAFDAPGDESALDLLVIQLPGASLRKVVEEMDKRLKIPRDHAIEFIKSYRAFKEREQLYPIHPYAIEAAKMLPHFLLLGLVALIWYNLELGGLKIYPYLKEAALRMALDWASCIWALPLFGGFALSVVAHSASIYRYSAKMRAGDKELLLDTSVTSLFTKGQSATPSLRTGRWWDPVAYARAGWALRAIGFTLLGITLLRLEPPSFATFMFVKGVLAMLAFAEAAAIALPLVTTRLSTWLEDYVSAHPKAGPLVRFLNQLNLPATRPASLLWLSFKYHFQPSVPTGGLWPITQAILFYLVFAGTVFFVGAYIYKQALEVWFQEAYRNGSDLGLVLGGCLFWNMMYLLRFGLFVLFACFGAALATYPIKTLVALAAAGGAGLQLFNDSLSRWLSSHPALACGLLLAALALMAFEHEVLAWIKASPPFRRRAERRRAASQRTLEQVKREQSRTLAVVYMSGDELSFQKLTPELLLARLSILREQLNSSGLRLLARLDSLPDDTTLAQWFKALYETEKKFDVTLWHPMQVVVEGETAPFKAELGLNLVVASADQRHELLRAWHLRRWLVTMMSTAGHAQDTGINLVDIALGLNREGLGGNTVFYLIQNKYDNLDHNRPSQLAYDKGELGQRNKLARLLMELAPGARAYSVNDWTPFGFKAGGLVGMDLVYEESLKLTNMLILDRNANAHDLDALMSDLKVALTDPGVVIVIPGRSTTNTLTPIGQASQLVEEGQRALTKGIMVLGGQAAESLGTGWGNIQAIYYGRVQRALCDPNTPLKPLTMRVRRGTAFGQRFEGLIGFGPHAIGISEDIWGVTQAAHNALALGLQIKFRLSQTLWHKIRESWSHAEWFSAFPRWSGGYVQMMLDPMMQRINDDGPLSVFAKEIRANGGRFFLGAPAAFLSILLMPLAIMWDFSPFVQILILLWNLGFVMNQVLTALGLVACLESTGFNRLTALLGTAVAAGLAATVQGLSPFALALMPLGFLAGGFALGLGRWIYNRGRDVMLFGPQLVIHALGQVVRQSLEFVLSGAAANDAKAVNIPFRAWAGPREDRPFETYQNLLNLRTVVWVIGLCSLALNLFALSKLDFLNVVLLLPSLLFSVSALVGPFILSPKPGRHLGRWVWVPKLLGWLACFGFYSLVAWLIARGGWQAWLGVLLLVAAFGRLVMAGLRYLGYQRQLRGLTRRLARQLAAGGLETSAAAKLAQSVVRDFRGDTEKTKTALAQSLPGADHQAAILSLVQDKIAPLVKRPLSDLQKGRFTGCRFVSEFARSFVLALFTFLWFFIVPIPGLLVFAAPGGYRLSMPLATVIYGLLGAVGIALVWLGVSQMLEWLGGWRLASRIRRQHLQFQRSLRQPGRLTPTEISSLYALFTDVQTYFDQRSYAYASRSLGLIARRLRAGAGPAEKLL